MCSKRTSFLIRKVCRLTFVITTLILSLCLGHNDSKIYRHPRASKLSNNHLYKSGATVELTRLTEELEGDKIEVENVLEKESQDILEL